MLHSFTQGGAGVPMIQAADGSLYGVAFETVFKITLEGTFTTLYDLATGNAGEGVEF
jgi:hypothetical protein